jgi:acetyl esterase
MNRNFLLALALAIAPICHGQKTAPEGTPYVYKKAGDRELKLYVMTPKDGTSRPAIVFFHGGGWVGGTPSQFNHQSEYLVSRGMVAVQVEYRLLKRESTDPPLVCVQDAKSAMRWVRAHAGELGIDPNRIASGGGSAGGPLAGFVGMVDGLDDPVDDLSVSARSNAMVLFNPVFDNGPGGWGHQRVGDRYREFSPFHNVTAKAPPAIVFVGSQDKLIPAKTVLDFKAAMQKAGVRCEAFVYDGQEHGFFNYKPDPDSYYLRTLRAADEFLASLGWLKGPPTLGR